MLFTLTVQAYQIFAHTFSSTFCILFLSLFWIVQGFIGLCTCAFVDLYWITKFINIIQFCYLFLWNLLYILNELFSLQLIILLVGDYYIETNSFLYQITASLKTIPYRVQFTFRFRFFYIFFCFFSKSIFSVPLSPKFCLFVINEINLLLIKSVYS